MPNTKPKGNFSRKHRTQDANEMARIEYRAKQKSKLVVAKENKEARANRTDEEQLALLDSMFGQGKGATKERARLAKKLEE